MPTPSIQTLRADAQQVLNLDSISAVRSVVAATLANANAGTPLNPNLTTQQLWNEFYQIVTQPKSDIESIIANQLMKFLYAPPAPGGAGADKQVIFNDGGVLAGDPQFLWNKTTNLLTVTGAATITGDLTVDTNVLKVNTTTNRVGINTTTPSQNLEITGSGNPLVVDGCSAVRLNNTVSGRPAVVGVDDSQNFVIWNVGTEVSETIKFLTGGGNGKEQYRITHGGLFNWYDGAGGTRMTLNSTGLGVGAAPELKLRIDGPDAAPATSGSSTTNGAFRIGAAGASTNLCVDAGVSTTGGAYGWFQARSRGNYALNYDLVFNPNGGNVGIGVTPSAWSLAGYKGLEIGVVGNGVFSGLGDLNVSSNAYYASGSWKYATSSVAATSYQQNAGQHIFKTAASGTAGNAITFTQAMTLDASGNLLVGTTSLIAGSASGSLNIVGANTQQIQIRNSSATAGEYWRQAVDSSNTIYILNNASTGVSITSGATSWSAVSDERLKDIIEPIGNAVAKVGSLRSVIGKYKSDSEGTRRSFLIAQDVQSVLPEAVDTTNADAFGVRYSEVIPLLVAAIKELTARVQTLETR